MAVIGRALSATPMCGMEYRQSSNSFLLGTNPSGIIESQFHGASTNELNQINMGSELRCDESNFSNYSPHIPTPNSAGESVSLFLGNEMLFQSAGTNLIPQTTSFWQSGQQRKKHKRPQDDYECPLKKRKFSTSTTPVACPSQPYWNCSQSQVAQTTVRPDFRDQPFEMMHSVPTEDMEEATVETQSEATLRRIRDIESRLVVEEEDEDDDEEEVASENRLPTLIMSEVLVEGLKKGLDESLTKKIVDSMSRTSMEIVLWKPQPEFLIDKLQSIGNSTKEDSKISKQANNTPINSFLQEVHLLNADKTDCELDTIWNRDEEEMEL